MLAVFDPTPKPNSITLAHLVIGARPVQNMANNPFLQRCTLYNPIFTTHPAGNEVYALDGWKLGLENNDMDVERFAAAGAAGISPYYWRFTKRTNAGKFILAMPLDYEDSEQCNGQAMRFQLIMRSDPAMTMRIGILANTGGLLNQLASPIVTGWNGAGVDPTVDATLALAAHGSLALTPVVAEQGMVVTPASIMNLAFALWPNAEMAVNDWFEISSPVLTKGTEPVLYSAPKHFTADRDMEAWFEKTYDADVEPGTVTPGVECFESAGALGSHRVNFKSRKIRTPAMAFYDAAGGLNTWIGTVSGAIAPNIIVSDQVGFYIQFWGSVPGEFISGHWVADAGI